MGTTHTWRVRDPTHTRGSETERESEVHMAF